MLMHPHIIRTYDVVETPTGIYVVRFGDPRPPLLKALARQGSLPRPSGRVPSVKYLGAHVQWS